MASYSGSTTTAFIDLATKDHLESEFLYEGASAITYFVRQHRRSTWFSLVPIALVNASGTPDFGNSWSVTVSRSGDYLLNTWLEVTTPVIVEDGRRLHNNRINRNQVGWGNGNNDEQVEDAGDTNYWCKNFMHNLLEECTITFNDLVGAKFTSVDLDFWTAFTIPASKRAGYDIMIGAGVKTLAEDGQTNVFLRGLDASVEHRLQLPLPFFFSRESGVALPTAALPFNDIRINFRFRPISQLLTSQNKTDFRLKTPDFDSMNTKSLQSTRVWANYAVVNNKERELMGNVTRDICIEQFQSFSATTFNASHSNIYDIRFSHSIKALMFGLRNTTPLSEDDDKVIKYHPTSVGAMRGASHPMRSDYDYRKMNDEVLGIYNRKSPLNNVSLLYENSTRLGSMSSEYFTRIAPFHHAACIPTQDPGIHLYSYSLDLLSLDPMGSTNFGKLTNVSIVPSSIEAARHDGAKWELNVTGVNHNVIRISQGALGFPVM